MKIINALNGAAKHSSKSVQESVHDVQINAIHVLLNQRAAHHVVINNFFKAIHVLIHAAITISKMEIIAINVMTNA